jgi:hypothetical protein
MKNLLVWTYPLVPDPRAVCSPMPLYIAAGGRGDAGWIGGGGGTRGLGRPLARFWSGWGRGFVLARQIPNSSRGDDVRGEKEALG